MGGRSPLQCRGLHFHWPGGATALRHCDLTIPRPGLWMLVGGNGSGKSTLLRVIAGLLEPQAGSVETVGTAALVFQNPDHQLLLPSCSSDLQLGLPPDLDADERQRRVEEALAQVGLAALLRRPIHTLSGGQKQRLAIAGALASGADLLLLDEPTALLDPDSQRDALNLVWQLCHRAEHPLSALWITHRLAELQRCDGAALMGAGRIGPWQNGPDLAQRLERLQAGNTEG